MTMNAIRSILLHLDATAGSPLRLALTHRLAERHGARITAMFGVRPDTTGAAYGYSAGAALRTLEEQEDLPHAAERARLRALCGDGDSEVAWCEVIGDTVTHGFLAEAAYADLIVLGRPTPADDGGAAPRGFVESVILDSGVPTVVVPPLQGRETIGERVLLAWNGSPQAARAMRAALPFLTGAAEVHVASWASHLPAAPYSRLDVAVWLKRHGIDCRIELRDPSPHVAAELAATATRLGSDLVVMGCYGHARLRERMFGGVTRFSLATLPIPVLMAH